VTRTFAFVKLAVCDRQSHEPTNLRGADSFEGSRRRGSPKLASAGE
jgi:hypothetical protein